MSTTASSPAASQAAAAAENELIKSTMGALLLGLSFACIFFGVTIIQTYQYYYRYWGDKLILKLFVAVIGIIDALQVASIIAAVWWFLIQNYGNIGSLAFVPWSLGLEVVSTATIGLLVQIFFACRVWKLSNKNYLLTAAILLLTLLQCAFAVYYVVIGQETGLASTLIANIWTSPIFLSFSIAADILITASLCWYLHRSRSGVARSDKVIDVLIVYTVNTGLLTVICALCTLVLSLVYSTTYWDTIFYFTISKCYVNSTLATLNARDTLRKNMSHWDSSAPPVPLTSLQISTQGPKMHSQLDPGSLTQFETSVHVDKHQITEDV